MKNYAACKELKKSRLLIKKNVLLKIQTHVVSALNEPPFETKLIHLHREFSEKSGKNIR